MPSVEAEPVVVVVSVPAAVLLADEADVVLAVVPLGRMAYVTLVPSLFMTITVALGWTCWLGSDAVVDTVDTGAEVTTTELVEGTVLEAPLSSELFSVTSNSTQ